MSLVLIVWPSDRWLLYVATAFITFSGLYLLSSLSFHLNFYIFYRLIEVSTIPKAEHASYLNGLSYKDPKA